MSAYNIVLISNESFIDMSASSSSKETLAVIRNLKETRVLEKSLQTLSLEESYAAKLLDLDAKMVRFNYGRLKKSVNKIKTHLQAEDIASMRRLEREGKFVPEHPIICTSSSSSKIAAAEKRLKLSRYRRIQSAMPALGTRSKSSVSFSTSNDSTPADSQAENENESKILCKHKVRPKTTIICSSGSKASDEEAETPRVTETRVISTKPPSTTTLLLEKISKAQKEVKQLAPAGVYSSHEEKAVDDDGLSKLETDDDSFGTNQYEERRKYLLGTESQMFDNLRDKKLDFVEQVEDMKRTNQPVVKVEPEWTRAVIQSIDSMAPRSGMSYRSRISCQHRSVSKWSGWYGASR